jgi:hypothetical protein
MCQRHFLNQPVPVHPAAAPAQARRSRQGTRGAGAHWSSRIEGEYQLGCVGQRLLEHRGHAISRNDIKPHARTNDDSGCLRIRVASLRCKENVDLASNIKIVCSAGKAGINHWSTGRREWTGAIRHDRHVRDRSHSRWRIVKAEDPYGQTEFGRQFLDRAGTPTGQHRLQITSPRLRGHKMPRIPVGAVNHPLCAAGHPSSLLWFEGIRLPKILFSKIPLGDLVIENTHAGSWLIIIEETD